MPPKKTAGTAKRATGSRGGGPRARATKTGSKTRRAPEEPTPFQPGFAPECMACPFGVFFYVVKNTRPDVMEHLMKGGFELFQAFKAMTEQAGERWEAGRQEMERITIT